MGVANGFKTLYSLKGLTLGDVTDISRALAEEHGIFPTIDVDCSNVCFKVGKSAASLSSFLMKYAQTGVCVKPVCDGVVRPISKQATNKRKASREKSRIKAVIARSELHVLRSRLYSDSSSRQQIINQIRHLEQVCKSAEKASDNTIQSNLQHQLVDELERSSAHTKNSARGYLEHVVTAEFQADALMVGRAANKESVMMITSDSDMVILAGDDSCALKSFTRDGTLEIVSTSEATIKKLMLYLSSDAEQRILFVPAKHPVFEGIEDRKLRALMCLFLGCDVYGGMKGVGPKSLEDIIKNKYDKYKNRSPENEYVSLYSYLKKYLYSKTNGMNHEIVQTYIQAMTCEPTNPVPTDEEKENGKSYRTYVNGAEPSTVPKYLEEFAAEQTTIKEGPAIALCIGVDECGHKFLEADGYHICKQCEGVVCNYCNETIGTIRLTAFCVMPRIQLYQFLERTIIEVRSP